MIIVLYLIIQKLQLNNYIYFCIYLYFANKRLICVNINCIYDWQQFHQLENKV